MQREEREQPSDRLRIFLTADTIIGGRVWAKTDAPVHILLDTAANIEYAMTQTAGCCYVGQQILVICYYLQIEKILPSQGLNIHDLRHPASTPATSLMLRYEGPAQYSVYLHYAAPTGAGAAL